MTDEAVSRRRENAAFFLRILAFGLIFTLISCAVLYVLTPKYDYGPGSMMNLPLQPRNTIDVLAVRSCLQAMEPAGIRSLPLVRR